MSRRGTLAVDRAEVGSPSTRSGALPAAMLASEVILRALTDACAPPPEDTRSKREGPAWGISPAERKEAWRFLTDERGPWAASRRDWAAIAALEENSLRAAALRRGQHPLLRDAEAAQRAEALARLRAKAEEGRIAA